MRTVTASIESTCPYFQSAPMVTPKENKESPADYDKRCWRDRIHANAEGYVEIPPMAFKFAIDSMAKKLRMKIPGKGNSEYGKLLAGGVVVMNGITLPIKKQDVPGESLFLHADGKRGGGARVPRIMPRIDQWKGEMQFLIVDDAIPEEVFEMHLKEAGMLIGIGQHRPENNGYRGRFTVKKFKWEKK